MARTVTKLAKADAAPERTVDSTLHIEPLKRGRVVLRLIGSTPLYYNAMSAKAMRTLLIGGGKKTAAEKLEIKHNPEEEFQESLYTTKDGPTLLCFPASGVKGAMATAALETKAVTKASVRRLVFLPQPFISVWGKPYLKMDIVRSAGMNKVPDIRTRGFLPEWCTEVDITYVTPSLSATSIVSLLTNAGIVVGIGDFRQESGSGSYGSFTVHGEDLGDFQETWDRITAQGRAVQTEAFENPEPYDEMTTRLLALVEEERERRA